MLAFNVGQTYSTRSICDYECIYSITIASRTAKTIKTTRGKTLRVSASWDGRAEMVRPNGNYSMAAIITADSRDLSGKAVA
jgi:hypothetical protein